METKRVVVTGLGCLTPIGNNVEDFWKALTAGVSGCAPITKFDTTNFKTKFACEIKGFNPEEFIDRKELRKMDPNAVYAMVAADQAVKDAGIDAAPVDKERCGVIFASGIGGLNNLEQELKDYFTGSGVPRFNPFYITKMITNMSAGMISIKHGFMGANFATVSACASSNHAIITAFNFIRTGLADIMVTGGTEAAITPSSVGGFNSMKALSTNNENYATASRPYDVTRDGFVIGEGAGAIVLEEYEHAKKRGAKIYAELCGGGMSCDAYHISATHPEGVGAALCMKNAIKDAGLKPEDINYVNTHGTSTHVGDMPELFALKSTLGDSYRKTYISSTKSMTGHLLGAASAIEAIASVLAIQNDIIPATINVTQLDPNIPDGSNIVVGEPLKTTVNYALSNSFGFGGHNASVIFGKVK